MLDPVEQSTRAGVAVRVRGLTDEYPDDKGSLSVLAGVDLDVEAGGCLSIMGRSGAGKSTLLGVLGGLERLQSGSVCVGDVDLTDLDGDALTEYRRDTVGFVFQHFGLLASLTALEHVELAIAFAALPAGPRRRRAHEVLDGVGLAEQAGQRPGALSGGESQRVAIAGALANQPRLVLADEPTGDLDDEATALVLDLLSEVTSEHGCTLVIVTHNRAVVARTDRTLRLDAGRLHPQSLGPDVAADGV